MEKYNDLDSDGCKKLVFDIKEAAMNCGYSLMMKTRNDKRLKGFKRAIDFYCIRYHSSDVRTRKKFSNSSNLADGTKIQFDKNHKRVAVRARGKKLPRKT